MTAAKPTDVPADGGDDVGESSDGYVLVVGVVFFVVMVMFVVVEAAGGRHVNNVFSNISFGLQG